ncbi:unnamed protein product [marine sediment metagenome]|uniref:Uncharacterized protein n=1 Tax=marine sediment metagenome TaxID=412755 RepID=X1LQ09_9ZZZZ
MLWELIFEIEHKVKGVTVGLANYKISTRDDLEYFLAHCVNESDTPDDLWFYRAFLLDQEGNRVLLTNLNDIIINKDKCFDSDIIPVNVSVINS